MARTAGLPKTGGRQKGTPNKKTVDLQDALEASGLNIIEKLAELLPQLSVDKQTDVLLDLMNYLYPKRKAIENSVSDPEGGPNVTVTFVETEEQKVARRERIKEKLRTLRKLDGCQCPSVMFPAT